MRNDILNQSIIRELRRGPKSKAALAMSLNEGAGVIQNALDDLIESGKVCRSIDGYQYEMASGGCYTGPGDDAA
ncbi:hypothetical protein [Marinobacter sp.]|uniref:hypothetical protein n=1 Tax=Marinobacter sp. TaxID=50741 RepID=UPI0035613D9F